VVVAVKSLAFNPASIAPGNSTTGTVTLTSPAPAGGATVSVAQGPISFFTVMIPAGQTSGTFSATAVPTSPAGDYPFTAAYGASTVTATLTVTN